MITTRTLTTALIAFGSLAGNAHAVLNITATVEVATSTSGGTAFSVGETVTVSYTVADGLGAPVTHTTSEAFWSVSNDSSDRFFGKLLWSDISISGATGSYDTASSEHITELSSSVDGTGNFYATAWERTDNGFGIFRGGEEFNYIDIYLEPGSLIDAVYTGDASTTPETTFINGTYDVSGASSNFAYFNTEGNAYEYIGTVSSITITGSTVPEASSYPLLMGLASLGFIARRNRIKSSRS